MNRQYGARFWKNIEQALLNERREAGWCPGGGLALWNQLAFYNFVQFPLEKSRQSPTEQQFNDSVPGFGSALETLRPERVLICGKRLWQQMDFTQVELNDSVQAYRLSDGFLVWCLAIVHPSSGRFSWGHAHGLITTFLNEPKDAATLTTKAAKTRIERS